MRTLGSVMTTAVPAIKGLHNANDSKYEFYTS